MNVNPIAVASILLATAVMACDGGSQAVSGSGGGAPCSVSLPAGCGCPDNPAGAWSRTFSDPDPTTRTQVWQEGRLPMAPDGSTVLHLATSDAMGSHGSSRLVKLDARGEIVWERPQPDSKRWAWTPTPDPRDCSTLVSGKIPGETTELLDHTVTCNSDVCPFVARLDAGGTAVWVEVYDLGQDGFGDIWIAGVLADGRIALGGAFWGTLDFGNGPLSAPPSPSSGVFAALLSPAGDALWSRHFVKDPIPVGLFYGYVIASPVVSPAGDIVVGTSPDGHVDFGEGPVPVPDPDLVGGLALASYDPTGAPRYGKVIFASFANLPQLAWSPAGNLVVSERATGMVDYGGGPVGSTSSTWKAVASFDAGGQHLWSTALDEYDGPGIAVDASNHVWVGAGYGSIAELDPAGALVATHPVGGSGKRAVSAIGFAPGGAPMITGTFEDTLDLGSGPIAAQSERDVFITVLAP